MNILIIINDGPYGTEKAYNSLRLALALPLAAALMGVRSVPQLSDAAVVLAPTGADDGDVFAEAAASTAFVRLEPRRDGGRERPSLYAPYWRSMLTPVPTTERVASAVLDGTPAWLAGVPR